MSVRPIESGILFQFVEDTQNGSFENATDWGFVIKNRVDDPKSPRWGKVLKVGPDVEYVVEGDYILIEKLMWTSNMTYENVKFWKTNEEHVLIVSKEKPEF